MTTIPTCLLAASLIATPLIATAATPAGAPTQTTALPGAVDTETVIHIPAWRVGDKAFYRAERILTRVGMAPAEEVTETPHFKARLEVEVVSEDDEGRSDPVSRPMPGTDVDIDGVEHRRVDVDARSRTATVTAAQVFSTDKLPEAIARQVSPMLKDSAVDTPEFRAKQAKMLSEFMAETGYSLSIRTRQVAADGQPWLRRWHSQRVAGGAREGKPYSVTIENRLERVEPPTPSIAPTTILRRRTDR